MGRFDSAGMPGGAGRYIHTTSLAAPGRPILNNASRRLRKRACTMAIGACMTHPARHCETVRKIYFAVIQKREAPKNQNRTLPMNERNAGSRPPLISTRMSSNKRESVRFTVFPFRDCSAVSTAYPRPPKFAPAERMAPRGLWRYPTVQIGHGRTPVAFSKYS